MRSRRVSQDQADQAYWQARAALDLAVEYVGAVEQAAGEPALDEGELERYERDIAEQLEEAELAFEDGLGEDVVFDIHGRREEPYTVMDTEKDNDEFYNRLDDAYMAVAATLDVLDTVGEKTGRSPLRGVDLDREYPDISSADGYARHTDATGLDRLEG